MRQLAGLLLFGWRYRLKVHGIENIPKSGPVLLLGNHISYIDFAFIQWATPRTIRFVVHDDYYRKPIFNTILRAVGAVSIRPENSRKRPKIHRSGPGGLRRRWIRTRPCVQPHHAYR